MLDKLKFNNLVISNKKKIQQARAQTINKQVQKLRKLKGLLEKKPDDEKTKDKIRKSAENMEQLKKMKEVDIMKQILIMDKKPSAIITNGLSTPAEVGIALLALNKIMENLIKDFRMELSLSESDDSWRQDILETSKRRAKIEHTEVKRRKRLEQKEQKVLERKRTEWLKENRPDEDMNNLESAPVPESEVTEKTNSGAWQVEESAAVDDVNTKPAKLKTEKSKNSTTKPEKTNKTKISQEKPKPIENKSQKSALKRNRIEEVAPATKHQRFDTGENTTPAKKMAEVEEEVEDTGVTHVLDPFFITETGENYLSTAITKLGDDSDGDEEQDEQNAFKQRHSNRKQETQRQQQHNANGRDERWKNNKKPQQHSRDREFQTKPQREGENKRHPSWVAKEKFKPVISKFEGKKITFDGNDMPIKQSTNNAQKSEQVQTNGKVEEGMHPSWVAKQKLKPKIAAFQGKKITFGNDDDE